ncbi:hypothetical protein JW964_13085 [candidate division KSB1 bacterium]|nr:hypothetical protein [candidate division KSB1 bacterium]
MFNQQKNNRWLLFILIAFSLALILGCAARKPIWGDAKSGFILRYQMPANQLLKYKIDQNMAQVIEVMGQKMKNNFLTNIRFSALSGGMENDLYQLKVTVDSISMDINTAQGDLTPDLSNVPGKSFQMALSVLGQESDFQGADAITYTLGQAGERNIADTFQRIFSDFADKPLKVGDSWNTIDTLNINANENESQLIFNNVNKLAALENINGMECVKLTADVDGTITGQGIQNGAEFTTKGTIKGTDIWYFAYKKGLLVKTISDATSESTVSVDTPQGLMNIPMTMEIKSNMDLVK